MYTQEDFNGFAKLSKDDNPIHTDKNFSAISKFGKPVAHGMFLYSNVCQSLNEIFQEKAFIQLSQNFMFPHPTYANEQVIIEIILIKKHANDIFEFEVVLKKENGEIGFQGNTEVQILHPNQPNKMKNIFVEPYKEEPSDEGFKSFFLHQKDEVFESFSEQNINEYQDLVKDKNKLFSDKEYSKTYGFEDVIIPGPLIGGIISYQLGTRLPGRGTNWLKFRINFLKPMYPNQKVQSVLEIVRIRSEKQLLNLKTSCYNEKNELLNYGEVLVLVSDLI